MLPMHPCTALHCIQVNYVSAIMRCAKLKKCIGYHFSNKKLFNIRAQFTN